MADEERLYVAVGVNEPAGCWDRRCNFAGVVVEDIDDVE